MTTTLEQARRITALLAEQPQQSVPGLEVEERDDPGIWCAWDLATRELDITINLGE